MRKDIRTFLITCVECFIILLFLGELLPKFIELLLNSYYNNPEFHKNTIQVGKEVNKGLQVVYNYMRVFKLFIY